MKPTVGRIVHFYTEVPGEQRNSAGRGPYAAVITQVLRDDGEDRVNLHVFSPTYNASDMKASGIGRDALTEKRYWIWPAMEME